MKGIWHNGTIIDKVKGTDWLLSTYSTIYLHDKCDKNAIVKMDFWSYNNEWEKK